jgi:chaperonin GroES
MNIQPIYDRVLVKVIKESAKSDKGVLLPDSMQKKDRYQVVALPNTKMPDGSSPNIPFEVGDFVLIEKFAGEKISEDQEEFLILRADDIIAYEII